MLATTIVRQAAMARPLTIALIYCIAVALAAPFSSIVFSEYVYNYDSNIAIRPSGFRFKAKAHLELLYTKNDDTLDGSSGQLVRLRLTQPVFYAGPSSTSDRQQPLVINDQYKHIHNPNYDLYARIETLANGTALIKQVYTHEADAVTFKNLKKSILLNLLPTSHHIRSLSNNRNQQLDNLADTCTDDNNDAQPELFSPDSSSQVKIIAKAKESRNGSESTTIINSIKGSGSNNAGPTIYQSVEGHQNVTFRSRVFSEAQSNLTTSFHLDLISENESNSHEKFDQALSMEDAIKLLDQSVYKQDTIDLEREKSLCLHHHCGRSLQQLHQDYKNSLTDESLATVDASVSFLRILDRLRSSDGTSVSELLALIKRVGRDDGVRNSILDILAAARTKDSIIAGLKFLRLPRNADLNTAERFLSVLSVSAKTASKMHLGRNIQSPYYFNPTSATRRGKLAKMELAPPASLEFIAKELLHILESTEASKWKSQKVRWSTLLTLATLVNANNQLQNLDDTQDELTKSVSKILFDELNSCDEEETDCRIVALQAIGNVGYLSQDQFQVLKEQVLNSGRRESITAMKVLRDLLQSQAKDKPFDQGFYTSLRDLLLRVVYDNTKETTARILASELIVRFVPNSLASEEILYNLPSFGNNELATMIYSRMQSLKPLAKHHENWYWKSCIINGTSTSFVQTMAKTDSLNASYGVNIELIDKRKMLKESSFDLFLDTKKRTQDLFSLGIFARGMSGGILGGGDTGDEANEHATAGMTLRVLGGYLRPYVFFSSASELLSHVWSGTAKDPTPAFRGDLLLIDHDEGYPLISGFVAEQQMRGVLSIDVTGKFSFSLWSKTSNAVVRTRASVIVQASQSVFTSYDNFWYSHLMAFGGQALIDVVSDTAHQTSPTMLCLQVTQPQFMLRYNSRRYEQMMTNDVKRKLTRKNFSISARSYPLNSEINKMCSLMNDEL